MGFWFGIFDKGMPWRKTPAKINDSIGVGRAG